MKLLLILTLACAVALSFAQCPPNERWRSCKRDQTCVGIRAGGPVLLPRPNPCIGGCRCHTGQVRDDDYFCIWPEYCFFTILVCDDSNAVRLACANRCPGGTCSHPIPSACSIPCEVNGCECRLGFLKLSSLDLVCVPRLQCGTRLGGAGLDSSASGSVEDETEY